MNWFVSGDTCLYYEEWWVIFIFCLPSINRRLRSLLTFRPMYLYCCMLLIGSLGKIKQIKSDSALSVLFPTKIFVITVVKKHFDHIRFVKGNEETKTV